MKKFISLLLVAVMLLSLLCACGTPAKSDSTGVTAPASDVAMQYITAEELTAVMDSEDYTLVDVRKAADHEAAHIPGALGYDMDAAKEGDFDAGVATMQSLLETGVDNNLVLICYSGKRYAQATTNVLSALGYDMSKVYTLEGGFTNWAEVYPTAVEPIQAPAEDAAMQYVTPAEALELLENEEYVFFDVRKAADYATSHIPGALGYDMDAAKEGDFRAGVVTMREAIQDLDKNIILICYSGKRYAQATTNVLSALGYDMTRVYTLEGGFTAWSEAYPDTVEAAE